MRSPDTAQSAPRHQDGHRCRIVLTGGPGGGKTTALDLFRREIGDRIVIVPEAASMLFAGGFPRYSDESAVISVQRAIYHVQRNLEDVQATRYRNRILLCDRGTVDGAAYWPEHAEMDFFTTMNTSMEVEFSRYDGVIFFESAAVGNMTIEGGNPSRRENNTEAARIDRKLHAIWSRHPKFRVVGHQASFLEKITTGLSLIDAMIEELLAQ